MDREIHFPAWRSSALNSVDRLSFHLFVFPFHSWHGRLFEGSEDAFCRQHTWRAPGLYPGIRQPLRVWGALWFWAQLQHLLPQQEGPAAALAAVPERWVHWNMSEPRVHMYKINFKKGSMDLRYYSFDYFIYRCICYIFFKKKAEFKTLYRYLRHKVYEGQ